MIQQAHPIVQNFINRDWKKSLINSFSDVNTLIEYLKLDKNTLNLSQAIQNQFKTIVPLAFAGRIEKNNPNDPLLKQVLTSSDEEISHKDYIHDPLAEKKFNPIPGLLHKYQSRVLLIAHSACAIHCRYCFRRHFSYQDNIPGKSHWLKAFNYIKNDQGIEEVILSGGDPLMHNDSMIQFFIKHIADIPHIKRLRIHSRIPVILPERITPNLLSILTNSRLKVILVIHANHANELDDEVETVLKAVHASGVLLLNQSTLLKDINDNPQVLHQLSTRLIECQVLPYYIHLLDKVSGAAHFDISLSQAKAIMKELSEMTSGFMVPKLAKEVPDLPSKHWVGFM
ncbi:EF-P beta-lysylation protein EpmB [Thiotrichales bacterium 19S9-12]|nr:EF-P beta-lysylation protein EpmB [Thiotrichales bacterium 19S9-11]MCF6812422.1 EF-P beta-lysylation protein EpmB [Thiotrichales bacterium 19S9-12]